MWKYCVFPSPYNQIISKLSPSESMVSVYRLFQKYWNTHILPTWRHCFCDSAVPQTDAAPPKIAVVAARNAADVAVRNAASAVVAAAGGDAAAQPETCCPGRWESRRCKGNRGSCRSLTK